MTCNQERRTTHARDFGKTFDWAGIFSRVRIRTAVLPTLPQLREINVGNRIERVIKYSVIDTVVCIDMGP